MRPHALLRSVIILAFLAWVLSSLIPFLQPSKHVRTTDTAGTPPQEVNPRPDMGALPPTPPLTEAQAAETLRQHGYVDLSPLQQEANGDWTAQGRRTLGGVRLSLRVDRDGRISER